ncbi:FAD-binding oxidoreductase [Salipaludibacillus sp. LMS25]|uniref:NAD(P)/FAD-dependent oxidoreductase n=1 Tax=Salipaludibacillus sp. LMS25 TaxID=2924031 RepID=UPI0020D19022|nr:FAD-dependent oxidoreductase [Salipaludibacillus sp. LMS25]UTR16388.1 FAD-binding oxidoreductase [Salipaludibacillus sp. LMS25]
MDIQSGTYYWPTTLATAPTYPQLTEDLNCDVLIIGGGSSGAQCAYYLANHHLDVVVVEKNLIGLGSTAANTALIQYAGEKMFTDLINSFGEKNIVRHIELCKQAIDDIEEAQTTCSIPFEFIRRKSLYFASKADDLNKLKLEADFLLKHGCPIDIWDEATISSHYPFSKAGALIFQNDAEMNPFKFTHALLQYANAKGVAIYENTSVNGITFQHDQVNVRTRHGHLIHAKKVLIASGYEGTDIRKEPNTSFVSTFTVTTKPLQHFNDWYERSLIWETARPYTYIRTTADNRVIIGGLDDPTNYPEVRDSKLVNKRHKLIEEFNKLFPHLHVEAEFASSAFYGGTRDGIPIIGEYTDYPHCYFLFAFGDNGTVYSMMLAKLLAEKLVSGSSPDSRLYHSSRPLRVN